MPTHARPANKDFIYAHEAKKLLRASSYALAEDRIVFKLPGHARSECWFEKEGGVGKPMVRKDYIAVCLSVQGLPPSSDLAIPEHDSCIADD